MRIKEYIRRFALQETGNVTVEFTVLVPLLFMLFAASIESGWAMTRWVMADRALDVVMRNLRLGKYETITAALLRDEMCKVAKTIADCKNNTTVELTTINRTTFAFPSTAVPCVQRTAGQANVIPVTTVTPGQQNDLMLVRVCVQIDAIFAPSAYAVPESLDGKDGFSMVLSSVFVNEPK